MRDETWYPDWCKIWGRPLVAEDELEDDVFDDDEE